MTCQPCSAPHSAPGCASLALRRSVVPTCRVPPPSSRLPCPPHRLSGERTSPSLLCLPCLRAGGLLATGVGGREWRGGEKILARKTLFFFLGLPCGSVWKSDGRPHGY